MGSPPRTRGKVILAGTSIIQRGITPAYAGKSLNFKRFSRVIRDHPRVRGEKTKRKTTETTKRGSPPRTRGKGQHLRHLLGQRRITPAYAGKSFYCCSCGYCRWDHPRVRGEKVLETDVKAGGKGSPPRTRGKAFVVLQAGQHAGITPAYAGKSALVLIVSDATGDHPRVRGEKGTAFSAAALWTGSPPRTRGKVTDRGFVSPLKRITPAYAGKSPPRRR